MTRDPAFRFPAAALAGLIAWAAVGLELWTGPVVATAVADGLPVRGMARSLHALFVLMFAVLVLGSPRRELRLVLAVALVCMTLAMVALYRYNSAAALLIIPMLEFASALRTRWLMAAYLAANVALAGVVLAFREMDTPFTYIGLHASLQLFAILLVRESVPRKSERPRRAFRFDPSLDPPQ